MAGVRVRVRVLEKWSGARLRDIQQTPLHTGSLQGAAFLLVRILLVLFEINHWLGKKT